MYQLSVPIITLSITQHKCTKQLNEFVISEMIKEDDEWTPLTSNTEKATQTELIKCQHKLLIFDT